MKIIVLPFVTATASTIVEINNATKKVKFCYVAEVHSHLMRAIEIIMVLTPTVPFHAQNAAK
jgi:hypothetical protein